VTTVTTDPQSPGHRNRRRFRTRREGYRDELMREWYGVDSAQDSNQGVVCASLFLDAIFKKLGLGEGLEVEAVKNAWEHLAGPFISQHSEPVSVRNGHLVLKVAQPMIRFQLEQMKPMLLKQLQERLGKNKVRSVRFQVG